MGKYHIPVFQMEVIEYSGVLLGAQVLDLTFGEGGHAEKYLELGVARVIGVDRDPLAIQTYQREGTHKNNPKLSLIHSRLSEVWKHLEPRAFDIILADLGVSTRQLMEIDRGFSFRAAGPLDMRMNPEEGEQLSQILSHISEEDLAQHLKDSVSMPGAHRISRKILNRFKEGQLQTTLDLADLLGKPRPGKTHPATVLFLSLRMLVNQEKSEVETGLRKALSYLRPGGRMLVISFHSNEDRSVKTLFKTWAGQCICDAKICVCNRARYAKILTRKPVEPSSQELDANPRSRSARLRCIEKNSDSAL